jgi:hypothetical protein
MDTVEAGGLNRLSAYTTATLFWQPVTRAEGHGVAHALGLLLACVRPSPRKRHLSKDARLTWPAVHVAGISGYDRLLPVMSGRFACGICAG